MLHYMTKSLLFSFLEFSTSMLKLVQSSHILFYQDTKKAVMCTARHAAYRVSIGPSDIAVVLIVIDIVIDIVIVHGDGRVWNEVVRDGGIGDLGGRLDDWCRDTWCRRQNWVGCNDRRRCWDWD